MSYAFGDKAYVKGDGIDAYIDRHGKRRLSHFDFDLRGGHVVGMVVGCDFDIILAVERVAHVAQYRNILRRKLAARL